MSLLYNNIHCKQSCNINNLACVTNKVVFSQCVIWVKKLVCEDVYYQNRKCCVVK